MPNPIPSSTDLKKDFVKNDAASTPLCLGWMAFDKRNTLIAGISFVLISLIALPIWLKTTQVERASIPLQHIKRLIGTEDYSGLSQLSSWVPLGLLNWRQVNRGPQLTVTIPLALTFVERSGDSGWTRSQQESAYAWARERLLRTMNVPSEPSDLVAISYKLILKSVNKTGTDCLESRTNILLTKVDLDPKPTSPSSGLTFDRAHGTIEVPVSNLNDISGCLEDYLPQIESLVRNVIVGERELTTKYASLTNAPEDRFDHRGQVGTEGVGGQAPRTTPLGDMKKVLAERYYKPRVTLEFILLSEESSTGQINNDIFNLESMIEDLQNGLGSPLSPLFEIAYRIKGLNTVSLPPEWRSRAHTLATDLNAHNFSFKPDSDFSSFLNMMDSIDSSTTGSRYDARHGGGGGVGGSCVKFLLYAYTPDHNVGSGSDYPVTFSSPGWGSVIFIGRPPSEGISDHRDRGMKGLISTLILHSFSFLDFPLHALDGLSLKENPDAYLTNLALLEPWRLVYAARLKTVQNLASCRQTLRNLIDLVQSTPNLVIDTAVAAKVKSALAPLALASSLLGGTSLSTDNSNPECGLSLALQASTEAALASTHAYYDSSLLELLYFPSEQKYAIYIPLFLPVGMGLLAFALALFKSQRSWIKLKILF